MSDQIDRDNKLAVELAKAMAQILVGNTDEVIGKAISSLVAGYARTVEPANPQRVVLGVCEFAMQILELNQGTEPTWIRKPTKQ